MARRIAYVTGKRGGFGALLPALKKIEAHPDLELRTIVTDMHLYDEFGLTVGEVERWVSVAERVDMGQTLAVLPPPVRWFRLRVV